ncbi:PfkB family carbohydrate kinase [Agromyces endophyticus]|uniref:1-phosphofructokinase family hexose kinase n=1 Tax=Agromyces sp. H17E-10 TaxID=2932244 RepID=UPI001FD4AB42|nr:PfkB family carbohydrate kinase [Agromyces sp. H17E-10]UOQ88362.1 PfkB family carbohydrate kinase [Agromyces sp. H17E-10]
MILTVTPNPAEDLTWHVDALRPGETHRVPAGVSRAGGKGLNVARVLADEGYDVLALTTAGGGAGERLVADLVQSGVAHRIVPVAGETRRSLAFVDEATGETSIFNELGAPLTAAESTALLAEAARLGRTATVVAVSGSLPPGLEPGDLAGLVAELTAAGASVIVDTSGPALVAAARAGATVLKPNRDELAEVTGLDDPVAGARTLIEAGARLVVVSLGSEGLVVVAAAEAGGIRARLAEPLRGNATGAGDAAVAAIAAALHAVPTLATDPGERDARVALARRATAWSASAVLMPLAGALSPEHASIESRVVVEPWGDSGPNPDPGTGSGSGSGHGSGSGSGHGASTTATDPKATA